MWSEVMFLEFREGAGIRAVLELLEPDSQVAQLSSPGYLAPVRGIPLRDYVAAVWAPHWTQHASDLLNELWEDDLYVFSLYHSQQPLTADSMYHARDGVAVCLQRDPITQFSFPSEFEAFDAYSLWGKNCEGQEEEPDLQWGITHVQLTHESDTSLISVGSRDLDWQTLWTIAFRFTEGPNTTLHVTFSGAPVWQTVSPLCHRPAR